MAEIKYLMRVTYVKEQNKKHLYRKYIRNIRYHNMLDILLNITKTQKVQ